MLFSMEDMQNKSKPQSCYEIIQKDDLLSKIRSFTDHCGVILDKFRTSGPLVSDPGLAKNPEI